MGFRRHLSVLYWLLFALFFASVLKGSIKKQPHGTEPKTGSSLETMLIDDFSLGSLNKRPRARWEFISDRVMGGASTGKIEFKKLDGRSCLHLTGSVFLDNNGGFIQARVGLSSKRRDLNAHTFKGISLRAKGNGQPYAIHLRTADTRRSWQFYQASFPTDGKWREIKIPFTLFTPKSLKSPLNTKALKSIAIVAIGREFSADILVDEIAFYGDEKMYRKLTPEEERVIVRKGTEPPFSGKYDKHFEQGAYACRRCGAKLFDSASKFQSKCGWPSFDDEMEGAVKRLPDKDGVRTEILCASCGGHLGHVFAGEGYTPKNVRHCVNSISLDFVPAEEHGTERAIFASGCFWGTEYHLQKVPGVISTTVGYTGGDVENPTYKQVCTDKTGHAEAVEVIYDPSKTTYEQLARLFFETHDFTQLNRQGPDVGKQYRSGIFYLDEEQKLLAAKLVETLKQKGLDVKTELTQAGRFWPAEEYHQDYYKNNGKVPYCHVYRKIF
jgi:peptide methionine sulfoxide reductase msrA/msrB